jgi:hypothetical protein
MNMKQVAELGYFIIKIIEKYELEDTVGLSKKQESPESRPQIWFIPDHNVSDYQASNDFLSVLHSGNSGYIARS